MKIDDRVYMPIELEDLRRIFEIANKLNQLPHNIKDDYIYPACENTGVLECIIDDFGKIVRYLNDHPKNELIQIQVYGMQIYQIEHMLKLMIRREDRDGIAPPDTRYYDLHKLCDYITAETDQFDGDSAF